MSEEMLFSNSFMTEEEINKELCKIYQGEEWDFVRNYILLLQQDNKELQQQNKNLTNILTELEEWIIENINYYKSNNDEEKTTNLILGSCYINTLSKIQELKEKYK